MNRILSHVARHLRTPLALACSTMCGVAAYAQPADTSKVEVTGTRILRTDAETALPVTVLNAEAIKATGQTTVAEVLRTLSFNTQGSSTPSNASTGQGVTDINLRGLGFGRTLVLVNGRRTPVDSAFFGFSVSTQFIPIGAVERIEVLRDGASAIYGSDAIGGVVNVILKERYDGITGTVQYSDPSGPGGTNQVYSITGGMTTERFSAVLAAEKRKIDPVRRADRAPMAPDPSLGFGHVSNSYPPTYRVTDYFGNGSNVAGPLTAGANCNPALVRTTPGLTLTNGSQTATTGAQTECRNPTAAKTDFGPAFDVDSVYAGGRLNLGNALSLFAEAMWVDQTSTGRSAAVAGTTTLAATNPTNPTFAATPTNLVAGVTAPRAVSAQFALPDAYGRALVMDTKIEHLALGGNWAHAAGELSFYIQNTEQTTDSAYQNAYSTAAFNSAVAAGTLNLFDTRNPVAFEPFLRTQTRLTASRLKAANLNWSSQIPGVALPGGPIRYGIGVDWRQESLSENCDPASGVTGGFCFARPTQERTVDAAYVEVVFPILKELELNYAGRQDSYDKPDIAKFTNRLTVRYQPLQQVTLRGSYAEGIRAPNLFEMNSSSGTANVAIIDRKRCNAAGGAAGNPACQTVTIVQTLKGGPDLRPEESKSSAIGLVWAPSKQFNASIDYYKVRVDNQILNISSQTVADLEALGLDLAPYSVSLTRDASGTITAITSGSANAPGFKTSGIDIEANCSIELGASGRIRSRFVATRVLDFKRPAAPGAVVYDAAGFINQPKTLFNWSNKWSLGSWSADLRWNYVGGFDARTPEQVFVSRVADQGRIGAYQTFDVSVTYQAPWKGRFTAGARNITDKQPTINRFAYGDNGFAQALADLNGRVWMLSYSQDFR